MSIITLVAQRTASGRTTSASHIAHAMSLMGLRTLAIDFCNDRQLSLLFGIKRDSPELASQAILLNAGDVRKISSDIICAEVRQHLDIIPSVSVAGTNRQDGERQSSTITRISTCLRLFNRRYDAIVIDTDDIAGVLTKAALAASSIVLIPVPARPGFAETVELLERIQFHNPPPNTRVMRSFVRSPLTGQPISADSQRAIIDDRLQLVNERAQRAPGQQAPHWQLLETEIPFLENLGTLTDLHLTTFDIGSASLNQHVLKGIDQDDTAAAVSNEAADRFSSAYMRIAEELCDISTKEIHSSLRRRIDRRDRRFVGSN